MMVVLHIGIALTSLVYNTFLLFAPSRARLRWSYTLIAATLLSGTVLVATTHAHMLQVCTVGLAYAGYSLVSIVLAHRKLAHQKVRS